MATWLYKGKDARIFEDADVAGALADGWVDSPAKTVVEPDFHAEYEEKFGKKADKRWSIERLKQELAK